MWIKVCHRRSVCIVLSWRRPQVSTGPEEAEGPSGDNACRIHRWPAFAHRVVHIYALLWIRWRSSVTWS